MINSKAIHTLRTFDNSELKRLRDFLHSPFFNNSTPVRKLYDELITFHPLYTDERLTYEFLHEKIYPGVPPNLSTMKNVFSDLLALIESFLVQISFENEKGEQYDCLLRQLTDRKLAGMFEVKLGWADDDYFSVMGADSWYFLDRYRFERNKYNFIEANDKILKNKELNYKMGHLIKAFVSLVNFFVMEVTAVYLNLQSYASDYSVENIRDTIKEFMKNFGIEKVDSVLGDLNEHRFIFELYAKLLKSYEEFSNEEKYFAYKETFNKYVRQLSEDEISFHLYKMIAYCIIKVNRGNSEQHDFNEELSATYNLMLENKYYLDKKINFMHHNLFREILLHSIRMKNFIWTRNFVEKYSDEVHPKMKKDMRNLGYAYLNFASGDLEQALKYVNKIPQDYFILKYDVKNLLLRIHTELNNITTALDLMHSYKEVLRNDKMISQERGKRYKNFLRFLERLLLKQEGKMRIDADYFFDRLRNEKNVAFKDWLVEKYETYLGKVKRTG